MGTHISVFVCVSVLIVCVLWLWYSIGKTHRHIAPEMLLELDNDIIIMWF